MSRGQRTDDVLASAQRNPGTLTNQPERIARLRAMVEDGASIREIQRSLNMGHNTILKYAPDAGWPAGGPKGQKSLRRLEKAVGL